MLFPLCDTIQEVLPALPSALLDEAALRRIQAVASLLPAALTRQMHLECRLGDNARVDLLIRVDREAAGSGSAFPWRSWDGISALFGRWQGDSRLATALKALWLELDLDQDRPAGAMPTPRLFLELRRSWPAAAAEVVTLIAETFSLLGLPAPGRALSAALGVLPPSSRLLAVGCDPARAAVVPRLCSWHPARQDLQQFLRRLPEARAGESAVDVLEALGCPELPLVCHLDGRRHLAAGIGIELTFQRRPQLRGVIRETPLLHRLVAAGLCGPAKADALGRWPGVRQTRLCHQLWPVYLVRRLNHVKLRIEEGSVLEAKGYLSFEQRSPRAHCGRML